MFSNLYLMKNTAMKRSKIFIIGWQVEVLDQGSQDYD
jgi:hypothetical protein